MSSKYRAFLECVKCCSQGTVGYLSLRCKSDSESQKKEDEEEGAEAAGDVAV